MVEQRSPKPRAQGSSPCAPAIYGSVVQLVRTLACHARGRGFEPHPNRHLFASVAQLVEQGTENPRVVGSIPTGGTISKKYADLAHLVERNLAKVEVAGSSPVIRSNGSLAQLGERLPYKQDVSGSIPLTPTKKKRQFSTESCRFFLYSYLFTFLSSLFTKNCRFQIRDKRE